MTFSEELSLFVARDSPETRWLGTEHHGQEREDPLTLSLSLSHSPPQTTTPTSTATRRTQPARHSVLALPVERGRVGPHRVGRGTRPPNHVVLPAARTPQEPVRLALRLRRPRARRVCRLHSRPPAARALSKHPSFPPKLQCPAWGSRSLSLSSRRRRRGRRRPSHNVIAVRQPKSTTRLETGFAELATKSLLEFEPCRHRCVKAPPRLSSSSSSSSERTLVALLFVRTEFLVCLGKRSRAESAPRTAPSAGRWWRALHATPHRSPPWKSSPPAERSPKTQVCASCNERLTRCPLCRSDINSCLVVLGTQRIRISQARLRGL